MNDGIKPTQDNKPKVSPLLYRINDAAQRLGVCRTTIYRMVKDGELDLVQLSRRASGITAESLVRLIERNRVIVR